MVCVWLMQFTEKALQLLATKDACNSDDSGLHRAISNSCLLCSYNLTTLLKALFSLANCRWQFFLFIN